MNKSNIVAIQVCNGRLLKPANACIRRLWLLLTVSVGGPCLDYQDGKRWYQRYQVGQHNGHVRLYKPIHEPEGDPNAKNNVHRERNTAHILGAYCLYRLRKKCKSCAHCCYIANIINLNSQIS